jgi:hypothetical protein
MPTRVASPSTEAALENRLADVLKSIGHRSHHNDPTMYKGIPDRYVMGAGGLWIEVKYENSWQKLTNGFERQRAWLDLIAASNDLAFVYGFLKTKENWNANKLYFEPWRVFKERGYRCFTFDANYQGSPYKIVSYDDINDATKATMKIIMDEQRSKGRA